MPARHRKDGRAKAARRPRWCDNGPVQRRHHERSTGCRLVHAARRQPCCDARVAGGRLRLPRAEHRQESEWCVCIIAPRIARNSFETRASARVGYSPWQASLQSDTRRIYRSELLATCSHALFRVACHVARPTPAGTLDGLKMKCSGFIAEKGVGPSKPKSPRACVFTPFSK